MYSVFEVRNGVSETGFGDKTSLTAKIVFTKKEKGRSDSLYLKKERTMKFDCKALKQLAILNRTVYE